jgi:DHA1 family bicyclomycin/chloramphenicol resistance-like MFS transporter
LYVIASLLCAAAPSIDLLIAARFLQSIGCCAAIIVARAIVRDAWPADAAPHVIAKASTYLSFAPLLGPIAGSYLQVTFGWRAAFVALSVLSATLLLFVLLRLPETNQHRNPHATDIRGLMASYRLVLGSREFWAHALPGALSYGSIFAFISGSSLVLIRVLEVPTSMFGYCFAFAVSGYLLGTIVCRRLLSRFGPATTLRIGSAASLAAGALFLVLITLGFSHWTTVVGAMFLTMGAHGLNFPVSQSGSVTPFPHNAGTAAGLMGALVMGVAFVVGSVVGGTFDGTAMPLALTACGIGTLVFVAVRVLAMHPQEAAA